jgi:hypothetical protein
LARLKGNKSKQSPIVCVATLRVACKRSVACKSNVMVFDDYSYVYVQCGSLTKQGQRCCNLFKNGSFCWVHSPKQTELVTCSICLNESKKNSIDNVFLYDCGHVFCKVCINTWINKNSDSIFKRDLPTCPYCRQDINCTTIMNSITWGIENDFLVRNRRVVQYRLDVLLLDEQIYFAANIGITSGFFIDDDSLFQEFISQLKSDRYGVDIYNKIRSHAKVGYRWGQKDKKYNTMRLFD